MIFGRRDYISHLTALGAIRASQLRRNRDTFVYRRHGYSPAQDPNRRPRKRYLNRPTFGTKRSSNEYRA